MPTFEFLALTPITVTAPHADTAAHCARNLLDDAHTTLDETCIGADVTTGETRLAGRNQLGDLAKLIQAEADVALRGATLSRTISLHRIASFAGQLLDALGIDLTQASNADKTNTQRKSVPDDNPAALYADVCDGDTD